MTGIATFGGALSGVRLRNRRGEGARLREDIVTAASAIIAETGDDTQLTLRGVAKRIGIAAPSIYRHFSDVDELKLAVVNRCFVEYAKVRDATRQYATGPADGLLARCRAYCQFALENPGPYRYMWSHRAPRPTTGRPAFESLAESIRTCKEAGVAHAPGDPVLLAAEVWSALHGLILLRMNAPHFPWPAEIDEMADQIVTRLVVLDPPDTERP